MTPRAFFIRMTLRLGVRRACNVRIVLQLVPMPNKAVMRLWVHCTSYNLTAWRVQCERYVINRTHKKFEEHTKIGLTDKMTLEKWSSLNIYAICLIFYITIIIHLESEKKTWHTDYKEAHKCFQCFELLRASSLPLTNDCGIRVFPTF